MGTGAPTATITAIRTTITTHMPMNTEAQLTLVQWLSAGFPVGAFSYSHGLERAVHDGDVRCAESFGEWLNDVLTLGTGRNDAILLSQAHNAQDGDRLRALDTLGRALSPSRERLMETDLQGAAFCKTVSAIWGQALDDLVYPVAVGAAARAQGIDRAISVSHYLHAFAANLTSAAIRLVPLGQTEGHAVLNQTHSLCLQIARDSADLTTDDLGGCCFAADIASMTHETQYSRLFRS